MTDVSKDDKGYGFLQDPGADALRQQIQLEQYLDAQVERLRHNVSGLLDLDATFGLVNCKLTIALMCLRRTGDENDASHLGRTASERCRAAAAILDELSRENVSLDQWKEIEAHPGHAKARELFNKVILAGGAAYFDDPSGAAHDRAAVSGIIAQAVEKYAQRDDDYEPIVRTERLRGPLRGLFEAFFHVIAPRDQTGPPYGIEEPSDEETLKAERIQLPLSQAVYYYEREVIPGLESKLENDPGNRELQESIAAVYGKIRELKQLEFIPRPKPFVMPHGYYTEGLTQYTADGELLVPVELPVVQRSGINIDRQMELVQDEVARRAAGRGLSPELDEELAYVKRLDSGRRGSSRFPRSKLNTRRGFRLLKMQFPAVAALEDRTVFKRLLVAAADSSSKRLRATVRRIVFEERDDMPFLP